MKLINIQPAPALNQNHGFDYKGSEMRKLWNKHPIIMCNLFEFILPVHNQIEDTIYPTCKRNLESIIQQEKKKTIYQKFLVYVFG